MKNLNFLFYYDFKHMTKFRGKNIQWRSSTHHLAVLDPNFFFNQICFRFILKTVKLWLKTQGPCLDSLSLSNSPEVTFNLICCLSFPCMFLYFCSIFHDCQKLCCIVVHVLKLYKWYHIIFWHQLFDFRQVT